MRTQTFAMAVVMALVASVAFAQRDAGSKARGEYNFYGGAAGTAMRSAAEYSQHYQAYSRTTPGKVSGEVSKVATDTIGDYITKASKHLASMRKHAEAAGDKETLASLDVIDKHLAEAGKNHDAMKETCLKDHVEGQAVASCCKVVDESLAKAISEHDKLMKRLAGHHAVKK